jgi:hypothetical protein
MVFARFATVLGRLHNDTLLRALTAGARRTAAAPSAPVAHNTVHGTPDVTALCLCFLADDRVARLDALENLVNTRLSSACGELLDDTIALTDAEAMATAVRPVFPFTQHAVHVLHALRQVGAEGELLPEANHRQPAGVWLHLDFPTARFVPLATL